MSLLIDRRRSVTRGCVFLAALVLVAHPAALAAAPRLAAPAATPLRQQLLALSTRVSARDAHRVAVAAEETSRRLAREYGIVGSAHFHNFLVNAGLKERGLCHHWARDLMNSLAALKPATLDLHWGAARAGTWREHNAVVVTAKGEPFASGIVLAPWRGRGRLFAGRVAADQYPWQEDLSDCLCSRRRVAEKAPAGANARRAPIASQNHGARAAFSTPARLR